MRTKAFVFLAIAIAALGGAPVGARTVRVQAFRPGVVVVKVRPGAGDAPIARIGGRLLQRSLVPGWSLVSTTDVLRTVARALEDPGIAYAEPDWIGRLALSAPNDSCYTLISATQCQGTTAWHLYATAAWEGWQRAPGHYFTAAQKQTLSPRVKVAVIDTARAPASLTDFRNGGGSDDAASGGQLDLAGAAGFQGLPYDGKALSFHGTYVAGLVAASANNSFGTAGVGFAADVQPLGAVDGDGHADSFVVANAIMWAWNHGARVINLSLGLTQDDSHVHDAIKTVTSQAGPGSPTPALVVAAAGNNTGSAPFYPGSYPEVVSVGGSDSSDRHAGCANHNANISVSAPAASVQGLNVDNTMTAPECGTSAAAPQVSGLAALLIAQNPARTPAQIRTIIEQTADDLGASGRDDFFGYGRINVDRALGLGSGPQTSSLAATSVSPAGGTSAISAVSSSSPVAAEYFLDRMPMDASDRGTAFSVSGSSLSGTFTSSSMTLGPHRLYARAKDSSGTWGPVASAVLYVDGSPPDAHGLSATNVVPVASPSTSITFIPLDDWSQSLTYDLDVVYLGQSVYHTHAAGAPAGITQSKTWTPAVTALPGPYTVRVTLTDEAGNSSAATATFYVA